MALADVAAVIKDRLRGLPPANLKGISSKYLVDTLINKEDRPCSNPRLRVLTWPRLTLPSKGSGVNHCGHTR